MYEIFRRANGKEAWIIGGPSASLTPLHEVRGSRGGTFRLGLRLIQA